MNLGFALMLVCSTAEQEYFFHSENLSWADARNHCQACYKDLVTLTPQNIQSVHRKLTSDCWVGLRKNFSSTTNSTTMTWPGWTRWANGDPLVFQNWYPGWPVLKSSLPKSYCCSCSCTCPATPTPTMTGFTEFTSSNMTSFTSVTDQSWTNSSGLNETNSAPMTTALPRAAECDRSPMLPDIPNIDENYIEDSCVAMLSFGAWVEKNCSELLPSICYEDIFHGQVNVTYVTKESANLTWLPGPGNISSYRLEVKGGILPTYNLTNLTYDLVNLTAGTYYSVRVFPVKCERDLNPQVVSFYTVPNKVEILNVTMVTETSVSLSWDKPAGGTVSYIINVQGEKNQNIQTNLTSYTVNSLIPGNLYTFTVTSEVEDKSQRSEGFNIMKYTKPSKVSNLRVSDITNTSLLLTWAPPIGNATSYKVKAVNDSNFMLFDNCTEKQTNVTVTGLPAGTKIILSVAALVNDTEEGNTVTIISYTVPNKVEILNVTMVTETSVSLSWDKPAGGTVSYIINVQGEKNQNIQTNLTSYTVNSLIPGNLYTFTVTSEVEDKSQRSDESIYPSIRCQPTILCTWWWGSLSEGFNITKYTKPSKVSNLQVSDITNTSLLLTWAPPIGNATSYKVKAVNDSNYMLFDNNNTVKQTNVNVTNLPAGTKIILSVAAMVNDTEEGDYVTAVNYTAPNPISNLNLVPTNVSLNATWDPPVGDYSSFKIVLQLDGQTINTTTSLTPRMHFHNLTAAAKYTVTVYSVGGNLSSTPVTLSNFTLPSPPTDITATSSNKSITFSWKAPVNSHTVNYSVTIDSSFWVSTESHLLNDQTSYTFSNLKSGTKYNFTVKSVAHDLSSDPTSASYSTVPVIKTVSLSMLCSSAERLYCDKSTTREKVFQQLKKHFTTNWGDRIVWHLEQQKSEN
ncbi:receptor-type tyrosine-protein phosphatase eta [Micropterus dolomieu]|uniref:receptor-type tyrosine-protein phosphatase eta n=1 Tax=Micropterus dolomieu TaxID=147949 RepID=UPI001E8CBD24|nr:receptor-type tyrosine-protein phosphatase eta [Micropterus dolomieu]